MEHLDKKLDKISDKIDSIDERLASIDITLVEQAAQLKHHIYRSNLNEENIEILRAEVKPLIKTHEQFNGVLKLVGIISGGLALLFSFIKCLEMLMNVISK